MENNNLKKNFLWNTIGTTLNAFNSLFFMIIVTRVNGVNDAGIFTLVFSLACLFFTVGIYAGRTYQISDLKQYNDKEYILHRLFAVLIMLVISLIYIFINGYSTYKFLIALTLCIYKAIEAYCDTYYGVLQKNDQLYKVGQSLVIKSILSFVIFFIIDIVTKNLLLSCCSISIVWLLIFLFYDYPAVKKIMNYDKPKIKNSIMIFKTGFFIFASLFMSVYITSAPKYAMDGIASDKIQAIFGIILMPATIITLCGQYLLGPFLNQLTNYYGDKDKSGFNKLVLRIILALVTLGLLICVAVYFVGVPILSIVYGIALKEYTWHCIFILLGGILFGVSTVLLNALTIMRLTGVQFIINICSTVIGFVASPILIRSIGLDGAVIAYCLIMGSQFAMYVVYYLIAFRKTKF